MALRLSGPSDLQTNCLIFGFLLWTPTCPSQDLHCNCQTATPQPMTTTTSVALLPTPPSPLFASVSLLCTPPQSFCLTMVRSRGWFIVFGRTVTELVNLLHCSVVGTTAARRPETPPVDANIPFFVESRQSVIPHCSFSLPHAPDLFVQSPKGWIGDMGEWVSGSGKGDSTRSDRGGRRGGKTTTRGLGQADWGVKGGKGRGGGARGVSQMTRTRDYCRDWSHEHVIGGGGDTGTRSCVFFSTSALLECHRLRLNFLWTPGHHPPCSVP